MIRCIFNRLPHISSIQKKVGNNNKEINYKEWLHLTKKAVLQLL